MMLNHHQIILLPFFILYPPHASSSVGAISSLGSNSSSPSSAVVVPSASSSVLLIVPLVPSITIGPNVSPASVLILATGTSLVWLVSHQLTTTVSPSPAISTLQESASVVLLRLILSSKVAPPSVEALNITSSFPFSVLFVHQAMYMLSPDTTVGALLPLSSSLPIMDPSPPPN